MFFLSLKSERKFKNWINSSGKDALPPDFYSKKYKFMLEVMRTDDYREGYNSPNAMESKRVKDVLRANEHSLLKKQISSYLSFQIYLRRVKMDMDYMLRTLNVLYKSI